MAPYGACEVAQSTTRSKAQFEAERFRKGLRRRNKQGRKCFRGKTKSMLESAFAGKKKRVGAVISSAQWPNKKACWKVLSKEKKSMLEQ